MIGAYAEIPDFGAPELRRFSKLETSNPPERQIGKIMKNDGSTIHGFLASNS
jgi:hypothetical protein